jgi:small-conductance mechanosensitive channel
MVSYLEQITFIRDYVALQVIILFVIYGGIAVVLSLVLGKIVKRLATFTSSNLDNKIIDCLHPAVSWTIIGVAFIQSLAELDIQDRSAVLFNMVCLSIILISWVLALRKAARISIEYFTVESRGVGQDLLLLLHKLFIILVTLLGIFLLLEIWQVNLTPLLASAGIAGIAVAMAAKDTLANFFGGISLFLDKTYKVGDYIIIDDKDRGEVVSLGIRSTRILTRDDVLVTVPNNILANSRIINETAPYPKYRIKIPVGVAYGTDLDHVEDVLLRIAGHNAMILASPKPRVRVRALADSSVNFELLIWVSDPRDRGAITHEFLKAIHSRFKEEGISIPFPQIDLHLDKLN